jgi:hypothetical protein
MFLVRKFRRLREKLPGHRANFRARMERALPVGAAGPFEQPEHRLQPARIYDSRISDGAGTA